ncbi:ABC transporter substrate-binding protein [Microbacterium kyungheense]|uniref:Carbohydrate ABC transporter substrate-binding protein (CUT1 family) n=1 Tax=Microbacterium kyungheense TaxID=1263636 RepID=A0A543EAJ2_9MICO|nr:ABC transporter substrate-binding protein [Microbacterium kyungheense]TQM18605.1 carbohydrate ABC transporter substrate-binding protein (CUT1 family) [Microbacterium kyungheense]
MKKWLKGTAAAGAAIVTIGALSACSGGAGDGTTEISFMMWGDGGDTQTAYEDVIAAFEEENPDISVNAEFFNTNDYDNILKTRLSGGAGPDVYGFDLGNIESFVADGFAADLSDGGESYLKKLTPEAAEDSQREGGTYNLPISLSGNGIIYNKALFEKAGITEEPTTYSELLEDAQKLSDSGTIPFAMSAQDNWWPQFIVYYPLAEHGANEELGAEMAAGEATFSDSKPWKESLDIVHELTPYYMPNPVGTSQTAAQSAFLAGQSAMFPATWILSDARDAGLDVGYMNFPTTDGPTDAIWGTYQVRFGVNPNNGDAKLAASQKFLDFFMQDDVYADFLGKVKLFPTTTTVQIGEDVDPLFPDMQQSWEGKQFIAAFSPTDPSIQDALLVGLQNVISGQKTTEQVLADLDLALDQYIANNK